MVYDVLESIFASHTCIVVQPQSQVDNHRTRTLFHGVYVGRYESTLSHGAVLRERQGTRKHEAACLQKGKCPGTDRQDGINEYMSKTMKGDSLPWIHAMFMKEAGV